MPLKKLFVTEISIPKPIILGFIIGLVASTPLGLVVFMVAIPTYALFERLSNTFSVLDSLSSISVSVVYGFLAVTFYTLFGIIYHYLFEYILRKTGDKYSRAMLKWRFSFVFLFVFLIISFLIIPPGFPY